MGFLSDRELVQAIADGHIRLDPYNSSNVRTSSIDLCLGRFIFRPSAGADHVINPADQASIDAYFGQSEYAVTAGQWADEHDYPLANLDLTQEIFVLQPGEWVLASLAETIGLSSDPAITCKIVSRSTYGRLGWDGGKGAGWIEPGYYGPIGLPISNDSPCRSLLLAGAPVAQGLFQWGEAPSRAYDTIGRYGALSGETALKSWDPRDILPKAIRL